MLAPVGVEGRAHWAAQFQLHQSVSLSASAQEGRRMWEGPQTVGPLSMVLKPNLEPQSHFSPASRWTCCPVLSLEGPGSRWSGQMLPPPREGQACSGFQLPGPGLHSKGRSPQVYRPPVSLQMPFPGATGRSSQTCSLFWPSTYTLPPSPPAAPPQAGRGWARLPWIRPALCASPARPVGIFFPHFYRSGSWHQWGQSSPLPIPATLSPNASPLAPGRKSCPGPGVELTGGCCMGKGATASLGLSALCASWGPPGGPGASVGAAGPASDRSGGLRGHPASPARPSSQHPGSLCLWVYLFASSQHVGRGLLA